MEEPSYIHLFGDCLIIMIIMLITKNMKYQIPITLQVKIHNHMVPCAGNRSLCTCLMRRYLSAGTEVPPSISISILSLRGDVDCANIEIKHVLFLSIMNVRVDIIKHKLKQVPDLLVHAKFLQSARHKVGDVAVQIVA